MVESDAGKGARRWRSLIFVMTPLLYLLSSVLPASAVDQIPLPTSGGSLAAWGAASNGELGFENHPCCPIHPFPVPVRVRGQFTAVAAGNRFSLALRSDGTVWAWGANESNILGIKHFLQVNRPKQVPELFGVVAIAAGADDGVALRRDGTVWTWGSLGELGYLSMWPARRVGMLTEVKQIAAAGHVGVALRSDGTVWMWGGMETGLYGTVDSPVQIQGLSDVKAIATGGDHVLAVRADGTVWAWGANFDGQLGRRDVRQSNVPLEVEGPKGKGFLTGVVSVAAGTVHSVALRSDGTVWAWGADPSFPAGSGIFPSRVRQLSDVTAVTASGTHTLALRRAGSVLGWGQNDMGQLGIGVRTLGQNWPQIPTLVRGLHDALAISTGWEHTLAITRRPVPAPSAPVPRACVQQARHRHVPGTVLSGARLFGLASDPRSGHVFALNGGEYDPSTGWYTCATSVTMLDGWNGRILRNTLITKGTGPFTSSSLAVSSSTGRVFAVEWGNSDMGSSQGTIGILDARSGNLLGTVFVTKPGSIAIDELTHRVFVVEGADPPRSSGGVGIIAASRGVLVGTVHVPTQEIAVDQRANHVFLLASGSITMLNGATGRVLQQVTLPPGQLQGFGIDEQTGRLFVSEIGTAPHEETPPPSSLTIIDSHSGTLVRTMIASSHLTVGTIIVDQPAGVVLSVATTAATVLDPRSGAVRRTVHLPVARFTDPTVVDPRSGLIYGLSRKGISVLDPHTWRLVRSVAASPLTSIATLDAGTRRIFTMTQGGKPDTVQAFCVNSHCR